MSYVRKEMVLDLVIWSSMVEMQGTPFDNRVPGSGAASSDVEGGRSERSIPRRGGGGAWL